MDDHAVCTIRTYRQWLKSTAFEPPSCSRCMQPLAQSSPQPVVRLCCFHLVHVACLQQHLDAFPPHTAVAGFICPLPQCDQPLLPLPDRASPAAGDASGLFLRPRLLELLTADTSPLALQAAARDELGVAPQPSTSASSSSPSSQGPDQPTEGSSQPYYSAQVASRKSAVAGDADVKRKPARAASLRDSLGADSDEDKYRRKPVQQLCQFLGIVDAAGPAGPAAKQKPFSSINKIFLVFAALCALMTVSMLYFLLFASSLENDLDAFST